MFGFQLNIKCGLPDSFLIFKMQMDFKGHLITIFISFHLIMYFKVLFDIREPYEFF